MKSKMKFSLKANLLERTIFVLGTLLVFSSNFFISNNISAIKDDLAYKERNINQVQLHGESREHWLAQYNNSVSKHPHDRDLIAINAFKLYTSTDQLITTLKNLSYFQGERDSQLLINKKNERFKYAEKLLKCDDVEALVQLTNEITEKHDQTVEELTKIVMEDWKELQLRAYGIEKRKNLSGLYGSILIAIAFLLREYKDYKKKLHNEN